MLCLCVLALVAACFFGSAGYSFGQTIAVLKNALLRRPQENATAATIILHVRLPRAVLAFVVGAALSAAGACMQGVFQNPMADPGILAFPPARRWARRRRWYSAGTWARRAWAR